VQCLFERETFDFFLEDGARGAFVRLRLDRFSRESGGATTTFDLPDDRAFRFVGHRMWAS